MEPMVWIDMETTGLDPVNDIIMEIGIRVTDTWGIETARITRLVTDSNWQGRLALPQNAIARQMHTESGLVADLLKNAGTNRAVGDVDEELRSWLPLYAPSELPMCGSSVHFDREFARNHMGALFSYFGYRNIDVSSTREQLRLIRPSVWQQIPAQTKAHRPQADLTNSIELHVWFADNVF